LNSLKIFITSLFPRAPLVPSWWRYLLLRRIVFGAWFQCRRAAWSLLGIVGLNRSTRTMTADGHIGKEVIPHNNSQVWRITRHRTERLINILRTIHELDRPSARVLAIGPRNEAELMLFWLYGFRKKNISSIDLFTYSPLIDVMDMHAMSYASDSFDVVYSSYVLRYSPDLKRACDEMVRVTKHGGLIVVAFVNGRGAKTSMIGSPLDGGLRELFGYFEGAVSHVYWQEEHPVHDSDGANCTTIFRITKAGAS
jgi:hypothetical protein